MFATWLQYSVKRDFRNKNTTNEEKSTTDHVSQIPQHDMSVKKKSGISFSVSKFYRIHHSYFSKNRNIVLHEYFEIKQFKIYLTDCFVTINTFWKNCRFSYFLNRWMSIFCAAVNLAKPSIIFCYSQNFRNNLKLIAVTARRRCDGCATGDAERYPITL